ncbi:MAG: hypothetical protein AAB605_02385 [Patescibacteria group bacterium]
MSRDLSTTVLLNAANLLEPDGVWIQRTWGKIGYVSVKRLRKAIRRRDELTAMCPETAIRVAAVGLLNGSAGKRVGNEAVKRVREHLRLGKRSLPGWNDESGRTKDEVVAALREAATTT